MKEVTGMLGKLFQDVKKSVTEIADAYKQKHSEVDAKGSEQATTKTKKEESKSSEEPPKKP